MKATQHIAWRIWLPAALVTTSALAGSSAPYLVKDINPNGFSAPGAMTKVGNRLFFVANDGVHGYELWVSDGTEQGTNMVVDLLAGPEGAGATPITDVQGRAFFQPDNSSGGVDLYVTDGTSEGTTLVVNVSVDSSASGATAALGDLLLFIKEAAPADGDLWKTDGTPAGTSFLNDVRINQMLSVGGTVFFAGSGDNQTILGYDLWKSDGTVAGTIRLRDLGGCLWLTEVNGMVFFQGEDPQGDDELWVSDGTIAGTYRVKDINPGGMNPSTPGRLTPCQGLLYFHAYSPGFGREFWKSDGTEEGTVMVVDLDPGPGSGAGYELTCVNGTLFFGKYDEVEGWGIWKSDGTAEGTVLVKTVAPPEVENGPEFFTATNGKLYFNCDDGIHGEELWVSDGTAHGTHMTADANPAGSIFPSALTPVGTILFFNGGTAATGAELWAYDTGPPIPTMSELGMAIMILLVGGSGIVLILRRGAATRHRMMLPFRTCLR